MRWITEEQYAEQMRERGGALSGRPAGNRL